MTKVIKIFKWLGLGAAGILILLITAAVLLPRVLNTDIIGRNLATELEAHYHIRSEQINISFLPFPRLALYGVRTTVPEALTASADTVFVYPKILPLLMGKFAPGAIDILSPTVSARLPELSSDNQAKSSSQGLMRLKDKISHFQSILIAVIPGVVIDVRNCGLELYCGQNRAFFFNEIDFKSSVHAQIVDFELTSGRSSLWQALSLNGWVDFGTLKSSGELNIAGGNPADLLGYLNMSPAGGIGSSEINLAVTLSSGGPKNARVEFKASVPQLTIGSNPQKPLPSPQPITVKAESRPGEQEEGRPVVDRPAGEGDAVSSSPSEKRYGRSFMLSNGAMTGALDINEDGLKFSISQFRFENPHLDLTANYIERYSDESVTLDIDGKETDAATLQSVLLLVDKENPAVRRVFEIIREAEIPEVIFSSRVQKASDLRKLENYTIKFSVQKGVVFAPKAELLVSNVSGNLLIEGGVLSASHLSGHTEGGSSTNEGELRIGLHPGNPLFHLDLPLTANLSELPAVLNRVVNNNAFRQELAQIKDVTGKAQGRLVLGESLHAITTKVETGPFQLSGKYSRLPEAIDLRGASFVLEKSKIYATSLAGKSGKSSLEQVDLSYSWDDAKALEIYSKARCVISMDILGPLLRDHECWKNHIDAAQKGSLAFDSFHFVGSLADPCEWVLNANGSVEDVVIQNKELNGPLALKTGAFEIDGDKITLKEIQAVLADSSASISGDVTGFIEQVKKVDLQLSGKFGPEGNKIIASLAGFPHSLRAISNLTLQSSRLTWDKEMKTAFKGQMEIATGPQIKIDLVRTPQELSIENLIVKDEDSDATLSIYSRQNQLKIGFSGTLSNKTADRLIIDNKLLTGPIQGKFNAHLYLDAPEKSSAQGDVKITGFQLPVDLPVAARIENAEIEADGNQLKVKSAMISWNGSRLSLVGNIALTRGAYLVDMNAFADSFDLETTLRKTDDGGQRTEKGGRTEGGKLKAEDVGRKDEAGSRSSVWKAPFRGVIRVRSEHLSYGKINWEPAEAEVVLKPESIDVRLIQADLCGISTPGTINVTLGGLNVAFSISAKNQDIESSLACLFHKRHVLSGSYTLTGNLSAGGEGDKIADSLNGNIELKAKDGRIFRFETLGKILSLLAVSEIYRGVLPDLIREGCEYKSIEAKGTIKNGKLVLSDSVVDGPCIKVVLRGEIDLVRQTVDVVALVAPLRTVERVVDATPIMGKVLNEAFLTLPVRISGNLDNPEVVLLSPSAVGEDLLEVTKKVFKLPLAIFQPLAGKDLHNVDGSNEGN